MSEICNTLPNAIISQQPRVSKQTESYMKYYQETFKILMYTYVNASRLTSIRFYSLPFSVFSVNILSLLDFNSYF